MNYKIHASLPAILICLIMFSPVGSVSAQDASPGQKQKPGLYLWSKTDTAGIKDEELASVYREADASLIDQARDGLASRGINVTVVKSEQELIADPARYILLVKLDKIELGKKRPFGRTAKIKAVYIVENKDRFDLIKRLHEETSTQKWQNCIKKISEQLVDDVSNDLAKLSVPAKAEEKQEKPKQAPAPAPAVSPAAAPAGGPSAPAGSPAETRLRELENLKAKGLITEQEYEIKRKEILNGL